jgi:hypothetical protein
VKRLLGLAAGAIILIALVAGLSSGQQAASRPAITIGPDTTKLEKPLRPDGTVDYLAALNELYGKGVTKDNNAAVKLLEAFGPEAMLAEAVRDQTLKILGVTVPEGTRFKPATGDALLKQHDEALKRPWQEKDYPDLAKWLKGNAEPLSKVVDAGKCGRYYMPAVPTGKEPPMVNSLLPRLGMVRLAAKALVIRANLAAGEGRVEDACQDVVSAYRAGILLGQHHTLVGRLVCLAVCHLALDDLGGLAVSGKLSKQQAMSMIALLRDLGPLPSASAVIDQGERWQLLDALRWLSEDFSIARVRELVLTILEMQGDNTANWPTSEQHRATRISGVDFNVILRRANGQFDDLVKALTRPTFAERISEAKRFSEQLPEIPKVGLTPPVDPARTTQWAGDLLIRMFMPSFGEAQTLVDMGEVKRNVTAVALALAAHKADKGKYPEKLEALAPDYLKAIPADFCSGKPLIYKVEGEGFVLYSVGKNMRDDGGKAKGEAEGCDDIVVKTPAK